MRRIGRWLMDWLTKPKYLVLVAIRFYQLTVSPDHSFLGKKFFPEGYCRYWPSCSVYGYRAVKRYGILRGLGRAFWRVMRCTPWSAGGIDEVK